MICLYPNCPNVKNFLAAEKLVNVAVNIIGSLAAGQDCEPGLRSTELPHHPWLEKCGDSLNYTSRQPDLGAGKAKDVSHVMHNSAGGYVKEIRTHYCNTEIRCRSVHKAMSAYDCIYRVQPEMKWL